MAKVSMFKNSGLNLRLGWRMLHKNRIFQNESFRSAIALQRKTTKMAESSFTKLSFFKEQK
jgi:hypothetical protein